MLVGLRPLLLLCVLWTGCVRPNSDRPVGVDTSDDRDASADTRRATSDARLVDDGVPSLTGDALTSDLSQRDAPSVEMGNRGAVPNGERCTDGQECASGHCVDGVCCDGPCSGSCAQCNLPNRIGKCAPVAQGKRPGEEAPTARQACQETSPTGCGTTGLCDGRGACALYGISQKCGEATCNAGTQEATPERYCDGQGRCATSTPVRCAPFRCGADGKGCSDTCRAAADCQDGAPCVDGRCGKVGLGLTCKSDGDCVSGNCVDGRCCNKARSECSGCNACNVPGSLGTCTPVPPNTDPHGVCAAVSGQCLGGSCNGKGACLPALADTICAVSCTGSSLTTRVCNGTSLTCPATGSTASCSGNYSCENGERCRSTCTPGSSGQCAAGYACDQASKACEFVPRWDDPAALWDGASVRWRP